MGGGIIQLSTWGNQNIIFNGDPEHSHFRTKFKRHTHFSIDHITLQFEKLPLQLSTTANTVLQCKIPTYADGLADLYLVLDLPDIWSPIYQTTTGYEFQWIEHIGFNMIDYVELMIGGNSILRHTGEYMKIQSQLNHTLEQRNKLDEMVGHVNEIYEPAFAHGRFNQYPHAIRPVALENIEPSIRGRTIIVPLSFFFCNDYKQILPLVRLPLAEVRLIVSLKPIYDLFLIKEVRSDQALFGEYVKPSVAVSEHQLIHFLSQPDTTGVETLSTACWNLTTEIEANYVFMEEDERDQLSQMKDYSMLYKEVRMQEYTHVVGARQLEIQVNNMLTNIVWVAQRTDAIIGRNKWDNYTSWDDHRFRPFLDASYNPNPYYTTSYCSGIIRTNGDPNIVQMSELRLQDGKPRYDRKSTHFTDSIQKYKHYQGHPSIPGIHGYSFALNNHEYQPSGALNASAIGKIHLYLETLTPPLLTDADAPPVVHWNADVYDESGNPVTSYECQQATLGLSRNIAHYTQSPFRIYSYVYNVRIFTETYNFLRIVNGTAGPAYHR